MIIRSNTISWFMKDLRCSRHSASWLNSSIKHSNLIIHFSLPSTLHNSMDYIIINIVQISDIPTGDPKLITCLGAIRKEKSVFKLTKMIRTPKYFRLMKIFSEAERVLIHWNHNEPPLWKISTVQVVTTFQVENLE